VIRRAPLPILFCLLLAGCSGTLIRRGPLDPALAAFIPPDTVALAGVRTDLLRETPIYRKLAAQNRLPRFDEFRTDSGFDPASDMRELLLASDGKQVVAIGRGDFKTKPSGSLKNTPYKGYPLYTRDDREVIAFPDEHTVLGGSPVVVRAAIDQWSSHLHGAPPDLIARARALPSDAQIWAVIAGWKGLPPDALRGMGNAGNFDRVLRQVEGANLNIDLRAGVHAAAIGDCRTEADAQTLSESLRGLAGLARLGVPRNQPDLLRVFDGIQVKQEGRVVKVTIDISQDLADQLADKARAQP